MLKGAVTVAVAVALAPLLLVAVMVQEPGASGAVYRPELETEPQEAVQVAVALAVNCLVACSLNDAVVGEMEKLVGLVILSEA
jgi:hypothetical protein